jgi:hypothetical protein
MSAVEKEQEEQCVTFACLAREALEERDWNVEKATNYLVNKLRTDKKLFEMLILQMVRDACNRRVYFVHKNRRAAVVRFASRADTEALAEGLVKTFLDFPLLGGQKLGDAKREDVLAAADFFRKQSNDMGHKARWLELIGQSIPAGKIVSTVVSSERLAELWKETKNG